jgi:hydroxymethylglutaryl-CoA lyase/(R)-citramalyl-CoA lyase
VRITLCDVGPRDGLQNEPETLAPPVRAELVNRLAAAGLPRIEAVSFVRDDRVPQMAGAEEVAAAIERRDGVEYSGLVLNERGWERFRSARFDDGGLDRVNVGFGATEAFNRANANASLEEAVARTEAILAAATVPATVTISVCFGCPFEGLVDAGVVSELAARFAGRAEVVLADTIGVATPTRVRVLVERTGADGFHGHNTRNNGYANALAAMEAGARLLDASVGGLGGCPYAPKATGNVATEDLAYLLEGEGVETGVDLDALVGVSEWLEGLLGRRLEGYVYRAGPWPPRTTPAV